MTDLDSVALATPVCIVIPANRELETYMEPSNSKKADVTIDHMLAIVP
nr:55_t:CDS:2 [Entrophospora candida]